MKFEDSRQNFKKKAEETLEKNGYVGISEKGSEGTRRIMGTNEVIEKGETVPPLAETLAKVQSRQTRRIKINRLEMKKIRAQRAKSRKVVRGMFKQPKKVKLSRRRLQRPRSNWGRQKRARQEVTPSKPVITREQHRADSDAIVYGNLGKKTKRSLKDFEKAAQENYLKEKAQEFSDTEVYVKKNKSKQSKKRDSHERG
ncbi:MAG TPA: hypothetical protein GX532_04845 [Clostridia bacterium]|jgi:hypothetical protein|nr:hypothetical protein [Clostridia bacterium]